MVRLSHLVKALGALLLLSTPLCAQDLGKEALVILRTHCYSCHGANRKGDPDYDVSNLAYLVSPVPSLIVPNHPETSRILQRIQAGEMPPKPKPPLKAEEVATLVAWVQAGAKPPVILPPQEGGKPSGTTQEYLKNDYVRQWIGYDSLRRGLQARDDRYLSLTNLFNTGADSKLLANTRAAVSKVINSLSFSREIIPPAIADKYGLVLRINLLDYGLTASDWNKLLTLYPYDGAPLFLRADWFIATASRPPLYYDLLHLPGTQQEFERVLGVNFERNFDFNILQRAAITDSAVAFHNRVLERHPSLFGSYWQSYDFGSSDGDQNVVRNPLGPQFGRNPFAAVAFRHDANESIAELPNGLDVYYVANAQGKRLDEAATNLVVDSTQISGTAAIVPGLSCMTCHTQGMQTRIKDVARDGSPLNGLEQLKLLALFPTHESFSRMIDRDRDRYVNSLNKAVSPFLPIDASGKAVEPIRPIVESYNLPLTLDKAALEIGIAPDTLKQVITTRGDLQQIGLLPLIQGQTITRNTWQSTEFGISAAQRVAQLIGE